MTTTTKKELQSKGIEAATRYFERRGYKVLATPYSCDAGEIEIVALDGDVLVFCEVLTSYMPDGGFSDDIVPTSKRQLLEVIAANYLSTSDLIDVSVRFDILRLGVLSNDRALIRHNIDALSIM